MIYLYLRNRNIIYQLWHGYICYRSTDKRYRKEKFVKKTQKREINMSLEDNIVLLLDKQLLPDKQDFKFILYMMKLYCHLFETLEKK